MSVRSIAIAAVVALLSLAATGAVYASGFGLDRTKTIDQIIADCDRTTGLPSDFPNPKPLGPGQVIVINPDWLRRPDDAAMSAAYPASARLLRVSGRAVVGCLVGADGHPHDCFVKEETPPNVGFGAAGLSLASQMLFVPRLRNCVPEDGAKITIPFGFAPP